MNRSTIVRTGLAGLVAGTGLAVGGIAVASADSDTPATPSAGAAAPDRPGPQHREQLATTLAAELGIEQATVQKALDAVREDLKPTRTDRADGIRPSPATDAERAARRAALASALAKELDVSEARVAAALAVAQEAAEAERAEHKTQRRTALATRLEAAVQDGTLTEADKSSVLKAFDADLLGGRGPGGPGGRGR